MGIKGEFDSPSAPENLLQVDRTNYGEKPILFDAETTHKEGLVKYQNDGSISQAL